ncbi:hypothetical protein D9M70_526510 [compost metagenome]
MGEALFIGQAEVDRGGVAAAAVARQLGVLEEYALVGVEVGVHLVGGDQAGQAGFPGVDQVAGGHLGAADAAVDRRGDAGEAEVQARRFEAGLDRRDFRAGLQRGAGAGVGQLGGDRVAGT